MLVPVHKRRNIVAKINENQKQRIRDFIQGSVYCFWKNSSSNRFTARDLFGGENRDWKGTPLIELYNWHVQNGSSDPMSMAAKDIGWLLLDVLSDDDNHGFRLIEAYTHEYECIKLTFEI